MEFSFAEKQHSTNLYACVLAQGIRDGDIPCYCYFGVFLHDLARICEHLRTGRGFNPKDFNGIVLARSDGEPTQEVRDFVRRKFSFGDDKTILEISRPQWGKR